MSACYRRIDRLKNPDYLQSSLGDYSYVDYECTDGSPESCGTETSLESPHAVCLREGIPIRATKEEVGKVLEGVLADIPEKDRLREGNACYRKIRKVPNPDYLTSTGEDTILGESSYLAYDCKGSTEDTCSEISDLQEPLRPCYDMRKGEEIQPRRIWYDSSIPVPVKDGMIIPGVYEKGPARQEFKCTDIVEPTPIPEPGAKQCPSKETTLETLRGLYKSHRACSDPTQKRKTQFQLHPDKNPDCKDGANKKFTLYQQQCELELPVAPVIGPGPDKPSRKVVNNWENAKDSEARGDVKGVAPKQKDTIYTDGSKNQYEPTQKSSCIIL